MNGGQHRQHQQQQQQQQYYRRFHDYASFSSFSDTSSCIVRRPSCDTISTYLSGAGGGQSSNKGSAGYRYGGSAGTRDSSYYGGSFGGSQDLIDMYGHEEDNVFMDEEDGGSLENTDGNNAYSGSVGRNGRYGHHRYEEPGFGMLKQRVLSDPMIHQCCRQPSRAKFDVDYDDGSTSDLYVNLQNSLTLHSRQASTSSQYLYRQNGNSLAASQNSLNYGRSPAGPQRGATVHDMTPTTPTPMMPPPPPLPPTGSTPTGGNRSGTIPPSPAKSTTSSGNGTLRKKPVPTPRTIGK